MCRLSIIPTKLEENTRKKARIVGLFSVVYLAGYLLILFAQYYKHPIGFTPSWRPVDGLSLLVGVYLFPYSIPLIWLAKLLEHLLILGNPIQSSQLFNISFYTLIFSITPVVFSRIANRNINIRSVKECINLLILCIIVGYLSANLNRPFTQFGVQSLNPISGSFVNAFLQIFSGTLSVSFFLMVLYRAIDTIRHNTRVKSHILRNLFSSIIRTPTGRAVEYVSLLLITTLGFLFISSLPNRQVLHYGILTTLPTIWLAIRFGTKSNLINLPLIMLCFILADRMVPLDATQVLEIQAGGSISIIVLIMLGATITDQKRIDRGLAISQMKFDLLAETAPIGVCQMREDLEIEYTNSNWEERTGLKNDSIVGQNFMDYIHPDDQSSLIAQLSLLVKNSQQVEATFRICHPDGHFNWFQGNFSIHHNSITRESDILCTAIDISNIKNEEQKLKENESLLSAFVNGITDPAWQKDTQGRYLAFNTAMEQLHGRKRSEIIGRTDYEIWDQHDADMFTHTDRQVVKSKTALKFESILSPDKSDRWYETIKSPIIIDGQVYGTTGISRDITERRLIETALTENEHRLKGLLNNIPDLAWMKDNQKKYLAINGIFCTTFKTKTEDLVGKTGADVFSEKVCTMLDQADDEVLMLGRPKILESVFVDDTGYETWYETIKMPMFDEKSQVIGLTGVARDITNRKLAEEAIHYSLETEKLISQISTWLNGIQNSISEADVQAILEKVGRFIQADRCYFIRFNDDLQSIKTVYSWLDRGIDDRPHYIFTDQWQKTVWLTEKLKEAIPIRINRVQDLPAAARVEMELALQANIASIIIVPVCIQNLGFTALFTAEAVTGERNWSLAEEQLIKVVSEMLTTTFSRLASEERVRRAESRYRMLIEQISAVVYIDEMDEFSSGKYISPKIEDLTGYTPKEMVDDDPLLFWKIVHEDDRERVLAINSQTNQTEKIFQAEYRLVAKDGSVVWVEDKAIVFTDEDGLKQWFGLIYNITHRKEIEEALQESQARFHELFEHSPVSLWEEDFSDVKKRIDQLKRQGVTDFRGYFKLHPKEVGHLTDLIKLIDVNQSAMEMTKIYSKEELIESFKSLRHLKPNEVFIEEMIHLANGETNFEIEGANDIVNGEIRYHQVKVMVVPGHAKAYERVIAATIDVTERRSTEEKLIFLSTHDGLSSLYSRSYFETELERLQVSRQYPISIVMTDIDYLKETNDSLGHAAGDQLILLAAQVLRMAFRPEDIIARIGGDEFAILVPRTDEEAAKKMVQRLEHLIQVENTKNIRKYPFNLSIGIATAQQGEKLSETLKIADQMMYEDKVKHHHGRPPTNS